MRREYGQVKHGKTRTLRSLSGPSIDSFTPSPRFVSPSFCFVPLSAAALRLFTCELASILAFPLECLMWPGEPQAVGGNRHPAPRCGLGLVFFPGLNLHISSHAVRLD